MTLKIKTVDGKVKVYENVEMVGNRSQQLGHEDDLIIIDRLGREICIPMFMINIFGIVNSTPSYNNQNYVN